MKRTADGGVGGFEPSELDFQSQSCCLSSFGLLYARKKENGGPPNRTDLTSCLL
jgi:hypothetical protein